MKHTGLRHLALKVVKLEECVHFYTELLKMEIEWQPDEDNVYLTSGNDNFALHRTERKFAKDMPQGFDHLGFIIPTKNEVKEWYDFLKENNVTLLTDVKEHRDGACSFYCKDPDGNTVQMIYHPPLVTTS